MTTTIDERAPEAHGRLLKVAAALVRGPGLDERFDLDERLPKWAIRNVEEIAERQRELGCVIRDSADKLRDEIRKLQREREALGNVMSHAEPFTNERYCTGFADCNRCELASVIETARQVMRGPPMSLDPPPKPE